MDKTLLIAELSIFLLNGITFMAIAEKREEMVDKVMNASVSMFFIVLFAWTIVCAIERG